MKNKRVTKIIAITLALVFGSFVSVYAADTQVTLDFEDLTSISAPVPTNYGNLMWENGWYSDRQVGANYVRHSGVTGVHFIYESQAKAFIDFSSLGKDVIFEGAWFGGNYRTGGIYFEGWRDGSLIATSGILTIDSTTQWRSQYLAANFGVPVDRVYVCVVTQSRMNEFIMDDFTYTIPGIKDISIDIKPYDENTVNLGAKGVLPICIYGSEDFDVTEIDPATVMIGNTGLSKKGKTVQFALEDLNEDGFLDAVCKFSIPELVENGQLNSLTEGLTLTGKFTALENEFKGYDTIIIVP
jgi:hypothetical protein